MAANNLNSEIPTEEHLRSAETTSGVGDDKLSNPTKDVSVLHEENSPKVLNADDLPRPEEAIERLGIENWRELEKKLVRRLDMTLLPTLWILYVFNYLDRASLGSVGFSSP
jgi:hypothetical protein